jgi:heterodisulfide reductase subunit C
MMMVTDSEFITEIQSTNSFNATACLNCGICTAICPMGLDILPRQLFRYVVLGIEKKILENQETVYSCLLCKMCEQNCPAEVKIAENVRILRGYINKKIFGLARK